METSPWPVPPPFMWRCARCTDLLKKLITRSSAGPGSFYEQLTLAKHIVADHPGEVPEPHGEDCALCAHYAKHGDTSLSEEHRVRSLFMLPGAARST
ncbi:hypothetical protein HG826_08965 [Streptomyces sp. GMY01]|uniref:hypothetical protein n=1 Tax=Streptomyces sp. GMY02 TaxID=1333528 RepID=UPI00146BB211|nr:hypothetical protein [Streptomyces sp. GMY02]NMO33712.1 hypothetical protein [Streptomyces sp. GMY02]